MRLNNLPNLTPLCRAACALDFQRLRYMLLPVRNPPHRGASPTLLPLLCCVRWCEALMCSCAAVAVVHVLQALVYIYLANKNSYFTWGAFFWPQFAMSHCTVLRRSMTSVASGKVLLLCLVPVIGWGVWCCSKKATRSHAAEVSLHNLQVCEKMPSRTASRAVLPLSSYCFLCSMF